jgi:hypothetical protein
MQQGRMQRTMISRSKRRSLKSSSTLNMPANLIARAQLPPNMHRFGSPHQNLRIDIVGQWQGSLHVPEAPFEKEVAAFLRLAICLLVGADRQHVQDARYPGQRLPRMAARYGRRAEESVVDYAMQKRNEG